jgi:hypothetical protein
MIIFSVRPINSFICSENNLELFYHHDLMTNINMLRTCYFLNSYSTSVNLFLKRHDTYSFFVYLGYIFFKKINHLICRTHRFSSWFKKEMYKYHLSFLYKLNHWIGFARNDLFTSFFKSTIDLYDRHVSLTWQIVNLKKEIHKRCMCIMSPFFYM